MNSINTNTNANSNKSHMKYTYSNNSKMFNVKKNSSGTENSQQFANSYMPSYRKTNLQNKQRFGSNLYNEKNRMVYKKVLKSVDCNRNKENTDSSNHNQQPVTLQIQSEPDEDSNDVPDVKEYLDVDKINYSRNDSEIEAKDSDLQKLLKLNLDLIQTLSQGIEASKSVISAIAQSEILNSSEKPILKENTKISDTLKNKKEIQKCMTNMKGMITNLNKIKTLNYR